MIKSTVEIIYNEAYQCNKCIRRIHESVRELRKGCTGKHPFKRHGHGFTYTKCPGNFYGPGHAYLLDVHRQFRNGVLASEGGLLDQPSKYLETMNLVETLVMEKEIERINKSIKDGRKQSLR
jgi:hypothetical protein